MEPDLALLDRYLAGDCTPAEAATVRRWLDSHPEVRELLMEVRDIREVAAGEGHWDSKAGWHTMAHQMAALDADRQANAIMGVSLTNSGMPESPEVSRSFPSTAVVSTVSANTTLPSSSSHTHPLRSPRSGIRRWTITAGIASTLAVAAIAVVMARPWGASKSLNTQIASRVSTYATGNGQRSEITLPDGSHVTLSVGSRLDVPVDYDRGNRRVTLSGQALFTVIPQTGTPFTVVTNGSETRVLGTSFLVRQYATDSAATVAVHDGKVMVRTTVLTAMQQVAIVDGTVGRVHDADSAQFTFAAGTLTLEDMPLLDAIPELNRWYDAEIKLGDAQLTRRRIAGGFVAGSATDLATVLELVYNVRVVRDGHTLNLYPGPR